MWYYMQDGAQQGPISEDELQAMAQDGRLQPTDMVWKSGMAEWQQANQIAVLPFSAPAAPAAPAPPVPEAPAAQSYSAPAAPSSGYGSASAGGGSAYSAGGVGGAPEITNYLPWSIAATLLCCLPAGIVSIIYASKANSAKSVGNFAEAQEAAKQAKTWLYVSVGVGLGFTILYMLFVVMAGVSGNL